MSAEKQCASCVARVWDSTGFHSHRCPNPARFGDYCGVHSPEKKAERAMARGPSRSELEAAARRRSRERDALKNEVIRQARKHAEDCPAGGALWQAIRKLDEAE